MGKTSKPWLKSWAIRVSASAEISSSTTEDASIFNKFWKSMKRNKESQAVTEKTMTCRFCTCQDLPEAVETHLPINKTGPLRPFPIRVSICLLCNFHVHVHVWNKIEYCCLHNSASGGDMLVAVLFCWFLVRVLMGFRYS